jgi:hypothetical protein
MGTAWDWVKNGVKITTENDANSKADINDDTDVRKTDDTSRQSIPKRDFK